MSIFYKKTLIGYKKEAFETKSVYKFKKNIDKDIILLY